MRIPYTVDSRWLMLLLFSILSVYIVYEQATDSNAVDLDTQLVRHERMLAGDSEFFNPWQYRVFSTYLVEGFYQTIHFLVPKVDRIYSFLFFRFLQNILIFYMAFLYYKSLEIKNPLLILTGVCILSYSMAHSVFQSDLSFNTYFGILFYLLGAWLIIREKYMWIIPLMFVAALNRETSLLIPAMLVVPFIQWKKRTVSGKVLTVGIASVVAFFVAFIGVRLYYGYQPSEGIHGMKGFADYLLFNIRFKRMYPELIGTLGFLPIIVLLFLRRLPLLLQQWFWIVCPVWFGIHLSYSTAVETRLFLVPQALIFIPAFLYLIEDWYRKQLVTQD
jgi:hypothetical protein